MHKRLKLAIGGVVAVAGLTLATVQPAQSATTLPVTYNLIAGYANTPKANTAPPGSITFDANGKLAACSSPGKLPIILVHGTWENMYTNWAAASPLLKNAGFCLYTFNYGGNINDVFNGTGPIAKSADQLAGFVDAVRAATGSEQVDLLGHSQGGLMPRYYVKFGNSWTGGYYGAGVSKIRNFVSLSPSNHGTTLSGLADLGSMLGLIPTIAKVQPAAIDQTIGSPFNVKLATCPGGLPSADICAGDTINYTVIQTKGDEVVTPYKNAFLAPNAAAPGKLTNILLQDGCFLDNSEHLAITYDSYAYGFVLKAFGVDPKKVPGASPSCKFISPLVGG